MFGHQDNQPTEQNDQTTTASSTLDNMTTALADQAHLDQQGTTPAPSTDAPADPSPQTPAGGQPWQHPGKAIDGAKDQKDDVISPAGGFPKPLSSKEPALSPIPAISNHAHSSGINLEDNQLTEATDDELVEVKQKALDELFPLIDKLNQTPEEHFKTLMMIIQASDNHTLIEKAYEIAQTIDDEKSRAQALLDIINEINYFTQQPEV
jgi:hypothetical protein